MPRKPGTKGEGVNYGAQTGKVNKLKWTAPRMRLRQGGVSRLHFTRL